MMGLKKAENQVKILLADTILALCRSTLNSHAEVSVEGLLGITLDDDEIFLVSINQTITNPDVPSKKQKAEEIEQRQNNVNRKRTNENNGETNSESECDSDKDDDKPKKRRRKRKRKQNAKNNSEESCSESSSDSDSSERTSPIPIDHINPQNEAIKIDSNHGDISHDYDNTPPHRNFRQSSVDIKAEVIDDDDEDDSDLVIVKEELADDSLHNTTGEFPFMSQSFQNYHHLPQDPTLSSHSHHSSGFDGTIPPHSQHSVDGGLSQQPQPGPSMPYSSSGSTQQLSWQQPCISTTTSRYWSMQKSPPSEGKRQHHVCQLCWKTFPSHYQVQRHMSVHTGERKFPCRFCGKCFSQKAHAQTHEERKHSITKL